MQAAISASSRLLPKSLPQPPTFRKINPSDQPVMFIEFNSDTMARNTLDEYAETLLAREISTVEGVAQVQVFGAGKYGPCASRSIPMPWRRARSASTSCPTPWPPPMSTSPPAPSMATASPPPSAPTASSTTAKEFADQVIAYRNGAPVRLGEVAQVLDGYENSIGGSWVNNKRAIVLAISRQPGSNTIALIDKIRAILPKFKQSTAQFGASSAGDL